MEQEIWNEIKGFEGNYSVSSEGRVRSNKRKETIILQPAQYSNGYLFVNLSGAPGRRALVW